MAELRDAEIVNIPFLAALADAVLGVPSAVWLATQARYNAAMRPLMLPKMEY